VKTSNRRWTIRLLLVLVAIGLAVFGGRLWWQIRPETLRRQAYEALQEGNPEIAELAFLNLLRRSPRDPDAYLGLTQLYGDHGAREKQMAILVRGVEQVRENVDLQRALMWAYLNSNRKQAAAMVAQKVADLDPTDDDAKFLKAWKALRTGKHVNTRELGKPKESLEALALPSERLIDLYDWDIELAQTLVSAVGDVPDEQTVDESTMAAFDLLERLVARRSRPLATKCAAEIATQLVELNTQTGSETDESRRVSTPNGEIGQRMEHYGQAAIAAGQATLAIYLATARAAAWQGDLEGAIDIARQGITAAGNEDGASNTKVLPLHRLAAKQLLILGRLNEVGTHIERFMDEPSTSAQGHLLAGMLAIREGRMQQALDHVKFTRKQAGLTWRVQVLLARIHLELSHWREALTYLDFVEKAYDAKPKQEQAWVAEFLGVPPQITLSRARACLELNRLDDAMQQLDLLQATSQEPDALRLLYAYHQRQGDMAQARQVLDGARQKYPRDLGLLLAEIGHMRSTGLADQATQLLREFAAENSDDLSSQLLLVQQLLQEGESQEAWELLQQLESRFGDSHMLKLAKAHVLLALKRYEQARDLAGQLRTIPEARSSGLDVACLAALYLDNPKLARDVFESAAEESPCSGRLKMWRGGLAAAEGDYESAVDFFSQSTPFTTLQSTARKALLESVVRLAQQQGMTQAEAKVDQLLIAYSKEPALLVAKADLAVRQRRFQEAIEVLDRLSVVEPNSATTHYLKAKVWAAGNRPDYAQRQLKEAIRLTPRHIPSHIDAISLSLAEKQHDRALEQARTLLKLDDGSYTSQLVYADTLLQSGKRDEAVESLQELAETQPDLPVAYLALASIYEQNDDLQQALQTIHAATTRIPDDIGLIEREINLLCRVGRSPEARALARRFARGWVPDFVLVDLGGQWVRAWDAFDTASLGRLAQGFERLGQSIAAELPLKVAEPALAMNGQVTAMSIEKWLKLPFDATRGYLVRNLRTWPFEEPNSNVCLRLGTAFQGAGQGKTARLWFHRALLGTPDSKRSEIYFRLGQSCLSDPLWKQQGELVTEAARYFEAVLSTRPTHLIAGNNLAWLLGCELDDPQRALEIAEQVRSNRSANELPVSFIDTLCTIYRKLGQFDDALALLTESEASYPNEPRLKFQLGMTHAAQGEAVKAENALRTAIRLGLTPDRAAEADRVLENLPRGVASAR